MTAKGFLALLVSIWLAVGGAAFAQEKPAAEKQADPGLKDVLTDLLESMEEPPPPPAPPGAACHSGGRKSSFPSRLW